MNIRDERTIGEQVKSGFRLAGWVLLTLAFIFVVLGSTASLVGKGDYTQPIHRVLGACGLGATSIIMFVTVRHWVKWFFGFLAFYALKAALSLLLSARPRLAFGEILVLLAIATVLCYRYIDHAPRTVETAGLVGFVLALSFSMTYDSFLPILAAITMLGLIQLAYFVRHNWAKLRRRPT